ncbi:MAG: hypothetical protein OK438_02590 [Thaumarchaeota archaeon]|nr:hypothetical protein [Nitrososphaerota archaeon]
MGAKRWASGILAVVGGFLMVFSGYTSRGLLFQALNIYVAPNLSDFLNGLALNAAALAVTILVILIGLGGITVLAGGLVILLGHVRIGRILIYLGGGAGFLGLLISFGYTSYKLGLDNVLLYAPYWVGLAMAIIGRRLAKGA